MPLVHYFLLIALFVTSTLVQAEPVAAAQAVPLVIGNRTIHTFRAPLGMFSANERAEGARRRIEEAFEQSSEGWTSVKTTAQGLQIELDGKPLFFVLPGDAQSLAGETPEQLANQASRIVQKAWTEAKERRDPQASLDAFLKVTLATALLLFVLIIFVKLATKVRLAFVNRLSLWMQSTLARHLSDQMRILIPSMLDRLLILIIWAFGLFLAFVFLTYSLAQFVLTRPASESVSYSIGNLASEAITAVASSLPGIFIAVIIFLLTWVITRIAAEFFTAIETRPVEEARLNAHTAPTTRRIVNAMLWLFAVAMAYPYLPGSHTEAFKGLSVIVGLMVSIGASGIVGQIASGVIIVYTYALKKGEYVRIQDYEGTVSELGLFVTRLRTGLGEEIAIPNAIVLGNVTRNYSRLHAGNGYVLDTTVTIGYDTPWRQVHAILIEATTAIPEIRVTPAAYVVQTALSDFYVAYKLVVHVNTGVPATRARVASDLHAAIQDAFNLHAVQIMSPHYFRDPETPKRVAKADWYAPPANQKETP